jgi:hypothetical protein
MCCAYNPMGYRGMGGGRKSVLSARPDGLGFYYGFIPGDYRQINVAPFYVFGVQVWCAWVGDDQLIEVFATMYDAERGAIRWMKAHPEPTE